MRTSKQKSIRRPEVRSLKIQPHTRFNRWSTTHVPVITLCGNWLQESGFGIDQRVTVTTMKGLLIVRLHEE